MQGVRGLVLSLAAVGLIPSLVAPSTSYSEPSMVDADFTAIGPPSEVPVALQNARWAMLDADVDVLTFRSMDTFRSLDDDIVAYLPELQGGGYDGVTVRQILMMRSGVDYEERYDFQNPGAAARNHILALVKNVSRFADPARTISRLHPPGEVFAYKTIDTAVLGWLIERVSGSNLSAYMASRLWEPLGAERDGFFIMDGPPGIGREFSGAGFNGTLRDFARFGLMMLNGGRINGHQVVSSDWVEESTRSSGPADPAGGGYGYQWWTMADGRAYAAIGLQGQFIYIDSTTRTVIVKFSHFRPGDESGHEESLAFFAAASAWRP